MTARKRNTLVALLAVVWFFVGTGATRQVLLFNKAPDTAYVVFFPDGSKEMNYSTWKNPVKVKAWDELLGGPIWSKPGVLSFEVPDWMPPGPINVMRHDQIQNDSTITATKTPPLRPRLHIYPNPSDGPFTIVAPIAGRLEIFDVLGRRVDAFDVHAGLNTHNLQRSSGVYFCKLSGVQGTGRINRRR